MQERQIPRSEERQQSLQRIIMQKAQMQRDWLALPAAQEQEEA
jgi:hypothetical protein